MATNSEDAQLEKDWRAARFFLAKGPSATLEFLKEEPKIWLHAYQAQALDGPAPMEESASLVQDTAAQKRRDAWRSILDMPQREAKKRFLELLTNVLPSWREWHQEYGQALIADRASKAFSNTREGMGPRQGRVNGDSCVEKVQVRKDEGEAERLLRQFENRTGVRLRSSL